MNLLNSRFKELSRVRALISDGISPEKLLYERSSTSKRRRERSDGGRAPEKPFLLRVRVLRMTSGERSGIEPESELSSRLRTRSWSRRLRVSGEKRPRRPTPLERV